MTTSSGAQGARITDNFEVYAPFDNERDWGPSFLVGPPARHLGDQSRVDDSRSTGPGAMNAADPSAPPLTEQPAEAVPTLP